MIHTKQNIYLCTQCQWTGCKDELELESIETCFGVDSYEVCPICGSFEIVKKEKFEQ